VNGNLSMDRKSNSREGTMQRIETMEENDGDEDHGTILGDKEYSQAVKNRDDIFLVERNNRFRAIEATSLLIGVILGLWLSTAHKVRISPDFYQKDLNERMAHLRRGPVLSLDSSAKSQKEPSVKPSPEEARAEWPSSGFSIPEYGKTRRKTTALLPQVKVFGPRAPVAFPKGRNKEDEGLMSSTEIDKSEDVAGLINIGNANKVRGNRADAFSAFRRVLKQNPHNSAALAGMGDLYLYTGILDSAANFYTAALAENPRSPSVHNGLGSVRYYLSVMAANPNFDALRNIKDPTRYVQEQYDSAIAEYTDAISLDSSRADALTNRGVIRDLHGDHAAALEDYTRAIKAKPAYAEAYAKRAATYKSLRNFKQALADYSAAIKLDSASYEFDPTLHFANAFFGRGNVEYQLRDYDKAIADFDTTLSLMPNHSVAMLNKARALVEIKHYDGAIVCYTRAIGTLSPNEYGGAQERAYFGRGVAYNLINQSTSALQDFNAAIKSKPDDYYAHFHRGNAFKAQTHYPEAIADYTIALAVPKLAAKACWRIAECYALEHDKTNALVWLTISLQNGFTDLAAWKLDPDFAFLQGDKDFLGIIKQQRR
jgi:tetratricopeptide (TPR) repeat protein